MATFVYVFDDDDGFVVVTAPSFPEIQLGLEVPSNDEIKERITEAIIEAIKLRLKDGTDIPACDETGEHVVEIDVCRLAQSITPADANGVDEEGRRKLAHAGKNISGLFSVTDEALGTDHLTAEFIERVGSNAPSDADLAVIGGALKIADGDGSLPPRCFND